MNHAIEFYRDTYVIQGTKFNGNEKISKKLKNKMYIKKKKRENGGGLKKTKRGRGRTEKKSVTLREIAGRERERKKNISQP